MRAQRLLSILLQLRVNRRITARELARQLEVSERTILRDMEALGSSGVPVIAERGTGGGWGLLAEYQTKLTGLSPEEVQSLFVSHSPQLMADLGLKQAGEAARIKLQATLPAGVRQQADFIRQRILIDSQGWRNPAESASSLPILLDALWRERQVRFLYEGVLCGSGERTVHPLGLVARGSVWYLVARRDSELRTYRLSRIRHVEICEVPVQRPTDFNLPAYWERSAAEFRESLPQYRAAFLVKPSVMHWIRYRGWRLEEEIPEGALIRVRVRFDSEDEALQFTLSFGGEAEVVEPIQLRIKVREAALNIIRLYDGGEALPSNS